MTDKEITKTFKKPLIWVSIIFIITIIIMGLIIGSLNNSIDYCYERQNEMYEEYDYKCGEGLKRACIDEDKYAIEIGEDETYVICDTDRKERAICIDEDTYWNPCSDGAYQVCVDKYRDYVSCGIGQDAKCIKEDKYATITSSGYVNYCDIGEYSTCTI